MTSYKGFLIVFAFLLLAVARQQASAKSLKPASGGKFAKNSQSDSKVATIGKDTLTQGLQDGSLVLIDVRSKESLIKNGKYPGSYVVPFSDAEEAFTKLSEDDFLVKFGFERPRIPGTNAVFSCRKGGPGIKVVTQLQKLGYSAIRCFEGNLKKLNLSDVSKYAQSKKEDK